MTLFQNQPLPLLGLILIIGTMMMGIGGYYLKSIFDNLKDPSITIGEDALALLLGLPPFLGGGYIFLEAASQLSI